jgi:FkbH-like protein
VRQTVTSEFSTAPIEASAAVATAVDFALGLSAVSQIVWGEHCSECDYPRCYSACSFYDPRPDLQCRRFEAGIEAAPGGLTRIRFRRWGKLEGQGPAPLRPLRDARRRSSRDELISKTLARVPAPFAVRNNLVYRWNLAKSRPPKDPSIAADAFVVEGWSETGVAQRFTLTFLQDNPSRGMFQTSFDLAADYSRLVVPTATIAAAIDLASPYLVQIEPVGEAEGVRAVFALTDFVAFATATPPVEAPGSLIKVVVWDLDETLWRGILAEDGAESLQLRPEAVAAIKALDAKGVLNSIASKNDEAEALAALRRFGLEDYFLHPQIGWGPKSAAVARIAAALDLGLDAFAFIDDQAFERAEVAAAHPAVRALPETSVEGLADHGWFDHPVTAESAGRRALYKAEAKRSQEAVAADGDYLGFLRSSELVLTIAALGPAEAERVYELSQRTNQLNFTGAKLSRDAVLAMTAPDQAHTRLTLRCADRFGDYGLIGFADLDLDAGELSAFFMSCRVQRKRVEHAAFDYAAHLLRGAGHSVFRVRFRATARNGAAVALLSDLGFHRQEPDASGQSIWQRSLERPFEDADVVRVSSVSAKAA